jgi:replicative DNA helicase
LYELSDKGDAGRGFVDFGEALNYSMDSIQRAYQNEGRIAGISTGFDDLDKRTGGLNNSDLIVLAGRPAMGKTALATNIAYNVADLMSRGAVKLGENSRGVAFFSLEMSADQLATRILSSTAGISSQRMRNGNIDNGEYGRIAEVARTLEKMPLYIDDTPGLTINAIRNRARRLKRTKGLGLIVIDYIQLIMGSSKRGEANRVQELSEISRGLKIMAKELDVPVIALSQLNRGVEQRDDKRPLMSDLRESGSIEQDADIVLFVYRENYYIQNEEPKETDKNYTPEKHEKWLQKMNATKYKAEIIIGKHRHGPTGTVTLSWNGEFAQFGNFIHDDQLPEQIG